MRRLTAVLLAIGTIPALIAAAPTGEPTVRDACGGGTIPHLDVCSTWISPAVNRSGNELDGLHLDLLVDGQFASARPTDQWAMFFSLDDDCYANVILFRDVTDAVGMTTMLSHFCENDGGGLDVVGRAILDDAELAGSLLHVDVPAAALEEVGVDLALGDTLSNVYSLTWIGQTTSVGPQAVYTWDAPDSRGTVTLEEG